MSNEKPDKPLDRAAYGSIPHLPGSRQDRTDKGANEGQYRMCCVKAKQPNTDEVIVQEKIDGSCCAVANIDGRIVALGRSGYLAKSSKFEQHRMFAEWMSACPFGFARFLEPGQRLVGEWIAQAHGTRYCVPGQPFVAFDIMRGSIRMPFDQFRCTIARETNLDTPAVIHRGAPIDVPEVSKTLERIGMRSSGAVDPIEGAVWRVERTTTAKATEVLFLAKWVRPDKVDGKYLEIVTGEGPVWNWKQ